MSLDRPKSDAELLAMLAERTPGQRVNNVALGPDSPLATPAGKRRAKARVGEDADRATEHALQVALFLRIRDPEERRRRPALAKVYAIPNGGFRTIAQAQRLKAEGVEAGVLDIECPVARGGYFGLHVEMKRPGARLKPSQVDWIDALEREGRKCAVHDSVDGAWAELTAYLDLPRTIPTIPPSPALER